MFMMRSAIARPREIPNVSSACGLYQDTLLKEGYAPWRYRGMMENR